MSCIPKKEEGESKDSTAVSRNRANTFGLWAWIESAVFRMI
jgi:hypothetical protein